MTIIAAFAAFALIVASVALVVKAGNDSVNPVAYESPKYRLTVHGDRAYGYEKYRIQQGKLSTIRACYAETKRVFPKAKILVRDMDTGRFVSMR